jgi:hypothetical protein
VVLYGCETWSLILREEDKLRVFENRVLRRIFGPKSDQVPGGAQFHRKRTKKNSFFFFFPKLNYPANRPWRPIGL